MLLDRRRIRRIAKWVALVLAIIFAGMSVFAGVGSGVGGSFFDIFRGGDSKNVAEMSDEEKIEHYLEALAANPEDIDTLLALANVYQQGGDSGTAVTYLEKVIEIDPARKEVYIRLANLYTQMVDYENTVAVLNKALKVDAGNPEVYLKLGTAQNSLGNTVAAALNWQKYLELAPNGEMATIVREQLEKMATTTTTVAENGTTSTEASTTTTAAATTTTTVSSASTTSISTP